MRKSLAQKYIFKTNSERFYFEERRREEFYITGC